MVTRVGPRQCVGRLLRDPGQGATPPKPEPIPLVDGVCDAQRDTPKPLAGGEAGDDGPSAPASLVALGADDLPPLGKRGRPGKNSSVVSVKTFMAEKRAKIYIPLCDEYGAPLMKVK